MKRFRFKSILRWSPSDRLFRLFRFCWTAGKGPGYPGEGNHSAKLSFALRPSLAFLRVKLHRAKGGHYV